MIVGGLLALDQFFLMCIFSGIAAIPLRILALVLCNKKVQFTLLDLSFIFCLGAFIPLLLYATGIKAILVGLFSGVLDLIGSGSPSYILGIETGLLRAFFAGNLNEYVRSKIKGVQFRSDFAGFKLSLSVKDQSGTPTNSNDAGRSNISSVGSPSTVASPSRVDTGSENIGDTGREQTSGPLSPQQQARIEVKRKLDAVSPSNSFLQDE